MGLSDDRVHRVRADLSLINGKSVRHWSPSCPVTCEVCGADVFLLDVEHFCQPGVRYRKVSVLAHWQWRHHYCGEGKPADPIIAPDCEPCANAEAAWLADQLKTIQGHHAAAAEALREAEEHYARAAELLARTA